jgi:hypothetical protein
MKKVITAISQRIDNDHVSIHSLSDLDQAQSYAAHNLEELLGHMKEIFKVLWEPEDPSEEPRTAGDWLKVLDGLSKKEH